MALSTYLANRLLDHAIGRTSFTMPPAVYIALFTTNPTTAGTGTETTYTGYARRLVAAADIAAASGAASTNANPIPFPQKTAGADPTVGWWASYDAATGGNMLEFGALTAPVVIANGDTPSFAAGALDRSAA
jgi:hypothetical protein